MNTKLKKKILIIGILALVVIIPTLIFFIQKITTPTPPQRISQAPNACPIDGGKCSWGTVSGATSYDYKIIDLSTNTQLLAGNTTATFITFQPEEGKSYRCEVIAKNTCGSSGVGSATGSCSTPPTATPTPTTPINTPTPSPTPTPTPTRTPTPTQPPVVINPPVNNPPVVNNPVIPTTPPAQPTIPPSGSIGATVGIVGGIIVTVIGGIIIFFL
ncbi:MAG TPA: hypothetical protein PKA38_04140 [Candidatus Levybacteria bacterium]|nr:hypothetical protein [Candidatus Levybacteria bacterium]